jgi:hypothetical protein
MFPLDKPIVLRESGLAGLLPLRSGEYGLSGRGKRWRHGDAGGRC